VNRSIDTAPHPDFRVYSAGNFAEIAPPRWSVMSWSLVGDPAERGLRAFAKRVMPSARWATGSHYVFVGYFSCRPYHNLSAMCHLAQELPGITGSDVTRAYFEDVPPPERELHGHCSAVQRALALPRMAREFHRLRPRLASLEADVALLEEEPEPEVAEEPEPPDVLFPGLASRDSRQRYLAGLAAEGLFHDLTPQAAPPPPPVAVAEPEPLAAVEAAPEPEAPAVFAAELEELPVFDLEETTPWAPPSPEVSTPPVSAPPPAAAPEPMATATLGELYLRQGYPTEAERIFREVLRREPESAAAREGLEKLAQPAAAGISGTGGARLLDAHDLLAGYQPGGRSGEAEGRARKAFLLSRYLERIRRGGQRDVS